MKTLVRWLRFNLVGTVGLVLQLGVLAAWNSLSPAHYLLASAVAVELALVHNFFWHRRYTWREREAAHPFVRFQVANGSVSVLGNLGLMRILVGKEHLPLIVANLIAISCCSLANFCLGDSWVFAQRGTKQVIARADF